VQTEIIEKNVFFICKFHFDNLYLRNNHINMRKYVLVGWSLLFCLLCSNLRAEDLLRTEYSYRRYTTQDGLPELITTSIFQDSKGFIWVGTLNGFARYDGKSFHPFCNKTEEAIIGFSENNKGTVFGLGLKTMYQVMAENDSLHPVRTAKISKDSYCYYNSRSLPCGYGIYFINSSKALCYIADSGLVKVWEHELLNRMSDFQKLYWDRNNQCFFIPTEQGLYRVGEDGIIRNHFNISTINSLVSHHDSDSLWAIADDGLYIYHNEELNCILEYPFHNELMKEYTILEDAEKNLIIRSEKSLFRYAEGKLELLADDIMSMSDMQIDNEGNIWIAASDGLYNFFKLNFKNYFFLPKGSFTQSIIIDKQNQLWMPFYDGRLICLKGENVKKINYPHYPYGTNFFDLGAIAMDDDLYLTGSSGILHHNSNSGKFDWLNLPSDHYFWITPLPNGKMAAGNTNNTYVYDFDKGVSRKYDITDIKHMILTALSDKQGNIWMGGAAGITVINKDSIQYMITDTLDASRQMIFDSSGKLWLICQNRLVSIVDNQIHVEYTFPSVLRSFYISRNGILVVATIDALYLSSNTENIAFTRYDQYNGFNAVGIVGASPVEDRDGYIWLLTLSQAIRFKPEKLLHEQPVPRLYLQSVQVSNDNIQWEHAPENNLFTYKNKNVKFSYMGLCYSAAGNIRYQYRLLGFQNQWSEAISENELIFNNLPPGNYTFQLKANASVANTETEVIGISFSIHPAFWQTTWFIVAAILTLMLASAGIALFYQRRKNKVLFEGLETEKQLNDLRIRSIRLKAIPHFNANVLAAIEYYIMNMSKTEALRLLGIYSRFTFQTLREVDRASRSLNEELEYVKMYLELEKLRFVNKFDYKIEIEPTVDADNVQLPNMILHTYCENAVKHGLSSKKFGGTLQIKITCTDNIVCVSVEDNGIGREAAARNKNIPSSKQGLDILSRQIEIYNRFNEIKINQKVDDLYADGQPSGTRFTVEVPYNFVYQ
jgi:ligand-binding sensor domain-containing protein